MALSYLLIHLKESSLSLFAFFSLLSAATIPSQTSSKPLTTSTAPHTFATLANGDVTFNFSKSLDRVFTANANHAACEPDSNVRWWRRNGLSSAGSCALGGAKRFTAAVATQPDLATDLLIMGAGCPILALGDLQTAALDLYAFARANLYFPTTSDLVLLSITAAITWAFFSFYNNTDESFVHQTIPYEMMDTSPGVSTIMEQMASSIDKSVSATMRPSSSRTCSSTTLDGTPVPMLCDAIECSGDGTRCGEGPWENCRCAPRGNMIVDRHYYLPFINGQQSYFGGMAIFPNCRENNLTLAPTGASSSVCICAEKVYSTRSGPAKSACFYTASSDLPRPITPTLYHPIIDQVTGCVTVTNTWTITSPASPTVLTTGDLTYSYTPRPSLRATTSIGCTCSDYVGVGATLTTISGHETWACITGAPSPTQSITAAPAPWQVKFFTEDQWCTDSPSPQPGYRLSGSGTQSCTMMPTGTGTWAKVGYVSMANWDYCVTLFDTSDCNTQYYGDMSSFCGPGEACVPLGPGYGHHAYEVNSNPWGTSSWAHEGLSPTIPACLGCEK